MNTPNMTGDRSFIITDDDKRGSILVVAIICCAYCPMILGLRAVTSFKKLGGDDILATLSTFTGIIYYAIIFGGVKNGLGRAFAFVPLTDGSVLGSLVIASEVFYFITIGLTKCSLTVLCRRLFYVGMKGHIFVCDVMTATCIIWTIASILTLCVSCGSLEQIGFQTAFCGHMTSRWIGVAIADAVTELLIFGLAIGVVIPLQMRTYRKFTVLLSFSPRLVIILLIGFHAQAVRHMVDSPDSGTNLTNSMIYLQIQIVYGIATAAIPAVIRSLRMFSTSMGTNWWSTTLSQSYKKSTQSGSRGQTDIALKSVSNRSGINADNTEVTRLRTEQGAYTSSAGTTLPGEADARSGGSSRSMDSQSRIIRKETHWHVSYDQGEY